jgi:beta-galactosidase
MKFFFVIACIFFAGYFNSVYSQSSQRQKINFDDGWKFHFGNAADPSKDFNYGITAIFAKSGKTDNTALNVKFKDAGWRTLNLPHDWAVELPFVNSPNSDVASHGYKPVGGLFPETSIGWYRKHFAVNKKDSGQQFQIQFDGIFRDANIWINGFYLGNNKSGYVGVAYDITDYLNYDKENVIVVRVDATQYEGWFYEGAGIYRHTWLIQYNNVHIVNDGTFIHTEVLNNNATINIETPIQNQNLLSSKCTVSSIVTDRNGKIIGKTNDQPVTLNINETKIIKQKIILNKPKLWSVDDPYLYRMITMIKSNGKIIDTEKKRFGVRTITINENGLYVNGKYLKIKGVNNHQDHAGVGSALPDYLQYYRIGLLKELGVNAYRTSHHAPAPELLDACDSLGMLVLDEQRLLNSSPEYLNQFERLLKRDRSHPSVFLWSIGNEEGWIQTNATGTRIAQTLLAKQKELDPARTSTYAADIANVFHGVNEVIPVRGFNYRIAGVDPYHNDHPQQPILGTEMGSTVTTRGIYIKDTINGYVPDEDITAPWWANTAEQWWSMAATRSWWIGGFVWTGFDYRGESTPYGWPDVNSHFGVMDVCGFPKNIYYYYQSWWTDKDVLHISPHWNWKGQEGKPIDVWVNTNADNVELFLNGRSLGKKNMPRNSHLQWSVNYEPGTLLAIAYKKGKKITSQVETTGVPAEVVITPYKTTMLADGKDATVINVKVIDKQGREVPDADNLIHFAIKGDAKITGVGNGNPGSHEADKFFENKWQRKLFNGKAQFIVQAGTTADFIHIEATSDSLYKASTDIASIIPSSNKKKIVVEKNNLKKKEVGKMLGADISFLPELEARGIKFSDKGIQKDAVEILKDHGINYIRLRIFNEPANDSGYSPVKGFCDLQHTLLMAKRIKNLGLNFLLDFHYSDTWADPGKQFKPAAWKELNFDELTKSLGNYTKDVMLALKQQNTLPDMVQVGNEINHGMVWPDGRINNLDNLSQLLKAGISAVKEIAPSTIIMLHIALGGQHDESVFFLDNMLQRGVQFDVIGESYYPKWHGTLDDLKNNLTLLANKYQQDIIVVEYSQLKKEVNKIAFDLPGGKGKGTCIWEPLNTWESFFDRTGKSNELITIYDEFKEKVN